MSNMEAYKNVTAQIQKELTEDAMKTLKEALAQPDKNEFNPDWDTQAVLVEEMQRMAKRIEELEAQPEHGWTPERIAGMARLKEAQDKKLAQHKQLTQDLDAPLTLNGVALYPQRTWVGLTDEELQPIADEYRILFGNWVVDFARAIEAALRSKNT